MAAFSGLSGVAGIAGLSTCASAQTDWPADWPADSLKAIARSRGLRFGSALGGQEPESQQRFGFADPAYRALIARECELLVHENEMKWQALRPSRDRFEFTRADAILQWAETQGLSTRGHTLLWQAPRWLPAWLNQLDFGSTPVKAAEAILREHIRTVTQRYGRRIMSWDVVNESVAHEDGELRANAFSPHLGTFGQVELAFRYAAEYAPHAELVYNDYMGMGRYFIKHRAGVLKLLDGLRKRDAPVHALGLQAHVGTSANGEWSGRGGEDEREWRRFLDEVTGMGLKLLITEFDVSDQHLLADTARRDTEVAAIGKAFLDITLSYRQLRDVLCWGMADAYSWLQVFGPRTDQLMKRGTPYDAHLQPKPLRQALAAALRAAPPR
ncbi:MAG: endo-1,4-beta-xylanase [Burkholderiales bacterium]|nr:endo-1,4-beta-xylanase [Burkholderiales bacterium]